MPLQDNQNDEIEIIDENCKKDPLLKFIEMNPEVCQQILGLANMIENSGEADPIENKYGENLIDYVEVFGKEEP
jgi:hypothetical protein